jgi:hypothetical protein
MENQDPKKTARYAIHFKGFPIPYTFIFEGEGAWEKAKAKYDSLQMKGYVELNQIVRGPNGDYERRIAFKRVVPQATTRRTQRTRAR